MITKTMKDFTVIEYIYDGSRWELVSGFDYIRKGFFEWTDKLNHNSVGLEVPPNDFEGRTVTKVRRESDKEIFSVGGGIHLSGGLKEGNYGYLGEIFIGNDRCFLRLKDTMLFDDIVSCGKVIIPVVNREPYKVTGQATYPKNDELALRISRLESKLNSLCSDLEVVLRRYSH